MDIQVPKILRPLDLREYAPEFKGHVFQVWVNPPRELVNKYVELQDQIVQIRAKIDELNERAQKDGVGEDITSQMVAITEQLDPINDELFAWYAEIWSQGNHQETLESVRDFVLRFRDTDPALWAFVAERTVDMIRIHREGAEKN